METIGWHIFINPTILLAIQPIVFQGFPYLHINSRICICNYINFLYFCIQLYITMPYTEKLYEMIHDVLLQFFVRELDGRQFEYHLHKESKGHHLLKLILNKHFINDTSYFGLKYTDAKGLVRWVNLRNPIVYEVENPTMPIKLELAVKYYVPSNLLRDYPIKKAFLLQIKNDICNGRLTVPDETGEILRFLALLAQAEYGAYFKQISYTTPPEFNLERNLIEEHKLIESMPRIEALDEVLKTASSLDSYGQQLYTIKNGSILISPHSCQYTLANVAQTFPLHLIKEATRSYSTVLLSLSNFEKTDLKIKLKSNSIFEAKILHRNIQEMLTFFTRASVSDFISNTTYKQWKGARFITVYACDVTNTCFQLNPSLYTLQPMANDPTTHSILSRVVDGKVNNDSSDPSKLYKVCSIPEIGRIVKNKLSLGSLRSRKRDCSENSVSTSSDSTDSLLPAASIDEVFKIAEKMLRCKLCDAKDCKVLFLPCCHFISCEDCSVTRKSCLECNSYITERVKVYIS